MPISIPKNLNRVFNADSVSRINTLEFENWLYSIKLDVDIKGTKISLNEKIKELVIYKLYDDFMCPVMHVKLNIQQEIHEQMCDNIDTMFFQFSMALVQEDDMNDKDLSKVKDEGMSIDIFPESEPLILEASDFDRTKYRNDAENADGRGFEQSADMTLELDLFLKKHAQLNRQPITGIYSDIYMDQLITYLMLQADMKCLIQPSQREKKKYDQILMPSKSVVPTLYDIQERYGIYKTGIRVFFDYDRGYCIPADYKYNKVCIDPKGSPSASGNEGKEKENVIVVVTNKTMDSKGSKYDPKSEAYYVLMQNTDQFEFADDSSKEIFGTDIEVRYITQEAIQKNEKNKRQATKRSNSLLKKALGRLLNPPVLDEKNNTKDVKKKFYYNKYDNDYAEESFYANILNNNMKFTAVVKNTDLSFLTPNKAYWILFTDENYEEYRGLYQLTSVITQFSRMSGYIYNTVSTITFKQLPHDNNVQGELFTADNSTYKNFRKRYNL